ncbi:hypothetical protein ACFFQW_29010 [Umezawaea endophytica]|uniref:Homeodomain-containing protein n=1 Tax=Umezawaea endophytica TaxID=1654476 RepID=A0A9X3AJ62_9PSEU|nr:hypothetical protein [Umezawaea endophytica]MCS7484127.1 hypothetical protein [Umezawaea endophytica]
MLRWHRDMLARRHAAKSRPKRAGRPRTVRSIRLLVLRLARENPTWGYRRIHGELLVLGITVAASTVWQILKDTGIDPAPDRASTTWTDFLRSQAEALLACDFFEVPTLSGTLCLPITPSMQVEAVRNVMGEVLVRAAEYPQRRRLTRHDDRPCCFDWPT